MKQRLMNALRQPAFTARWPLFFKTAFVLTTLLVGGGFSLFGPPAPPSPGTLLTRRQLANVGCATPEATLETYLFAMVNGDYDAGVPTVLSYQATREFGRDANKFKRESTKENQDFKSLQILARKNIAPDKVELKFESLDQGDDSGNADPEVVALAKVGGQWKIDIGLNPDYTTNWDTSDVITYARVRPRKPSSHLNGGICISAAQLTNAGDDTPEAAVETETWATVNNQTNELTAAYSPAMQEERKSRPVRDEMVLRYGNSRIDPKKIEHAFTELIMMAKKTLNDDTVELKISKMERQTSPDGASIFGSVRVLQLVKIDHHWKINAEQFYQPNWDNGSEPEPTVRR